MKKKRNALNVLLLQIRQDEVTAKEETQAFADYGQLALNQVSVLNVFQQPEFEPNLMDDFDALFIGGSSDASVLKRQQYPFVDDCCRLVRYCYQHNIPVFASCFGFQIAVVELGGEVIHDRGNMEIGIYKIDMLEASQEDEFLHYLPDYFYAVSGHQERASRLPENAIALAKSNLCPYHAFTFADKPFYAFQFHPEINREVLCNRLTRYQQRYLGEEHCLASILAEATQETDNANQLVANFIEHYLVSE